MHKIDKQIIEAVNSVVNPDTTDTDQLVIEYLEGYFGNELNESTSDDDIMEAFDELLETADAVEEFMIQEGPMAMLKKIGPAIRQRIGSVRTGIQNRSDLKKIRLQRKNRQSTIGKGFQGGKGKRSMFSPSRETSHRSDARRTRYPRS